MTLISDERSVCKLARGSLAFAFSSSEPGVKHALPLRKDRGFRLWACLTPGSEEEKQRFALPFGSKSRRAPGEFASVIRVLNIRFHIYEQQYLVIISR